MVSAEGANHVDNRSSGRQLVLKIDLDWTSHDFREFFRSLDVLVRSVDEMANRVYQPADEMKRELARIRRTVPMREAWAPAVDSVVYSSPGIIKVDLGSLPAGIGTLIRSLVTLRQDLLQARAKTAQAQSLAQRSQDATLHARRMDEIEYVRELNKLGLELKTDALVAVVGMSLEDVGREVRLGIIEPAELLADYVLQGKVTDVVEVGPGESANEVVPSD